MRFTLARKILRERFGWIVMHEAKNKVLYGHTSVSTRRRESAEVRGHADLRPAPALVVTIIPTYRRPELLLRAVQSALKQTVTDQLIVVVDDAGGLPDLPDDPRLLAFSVSRNIGVAGVNRNIAMRLTQSRFVAFLDDDNEWRPNHLETALARLDQPGGPDAVYTAMARVTPEGEVRNIVSEPWDRKKATNHGYIDVNTLVALRAPDLFFSRIHRAKHVMPKEDWELVYRYSRRHRIEHVPEVTVDYLVNPDSYWTHW